MNLATAAMILDADAIAADLRAVASAGIEPVSEPELVSLWIKPGHYFNAFYRFGCSDGGSFEVSAHVVEPGRGKRIMASAQEHTCATSERGACFRCSTALTRRDILVQAFPWDYRLPTLPRCTDAREVRRTADVAVEACDVLAYRPGMRCAARYRTANGTNIFGKVSVENRGRGYAFRTQSLLRDAIRLAGLPMRVPEPIAYVEELALTAVADLGGVNLHDLMAAGACVDKEVVAAARILGALHELAFVVADRAFAASDEFHLVSQWVELSRELSPALSVALEQALERLARTIPEARAVPSLLHRDFYDKQILFTRGEAPAVLDLDTAAMGDRELDVANFCAHMRLRGLQFDRVGECRGWGDAFVEAYPHALERGRLDWYLRSTLVRLACNYALRPRWRRFAADLAAAAMEG